MEWREPPASTIPAVDRVEALLFAGPQAEVPGNLARLLVARWRELQGWYWTYTVNFLIALKGGWGAAPLHSGHLWSLAIEEQFYLVWPFVVWKLDRRTLMTVCLSVVVAVLVLKTCGLDL